MTAHLFVEAPGLFTTVQDAGRRGHQEFGMPVAGALDRIGLRLANALAGNDANAGALEISYLGPAFRVDAGSVRVAIAGPVRAEIRPAGGGEPRLLPPWRSVTLHRGDHLKLGAVEGAAVAYLAVGGGFALPSFLGSQSTYTRAALGGLEGRALRAGDRLPLALPEAPGREELELPGPPDYGSGPVRVVLGPQDDRFGAEAYDLLFSSDYTVTKEADRMGLRLEGPPIPHLRGADIASEGTVNGAIQVPGNGKPILLLADRQTTGGYTKIATVISADLPRVGRLAPGARLAFAPVTVAEGEALARAQEAALRGLIDGLRTPAGAALDLAALYAENLISGAVDARV